MSKGRGRDARSTICRLVRLLGDEGIAEKFHYDDEAIWSMTSFAIGYELCCDLHALPGITSFATITDTTASVGGSTIPFAKYFQHVNAIEIHAGRKRMLDDNLTLCGIMNVNTILGDFSRVLPSLAQDVIFIDPPWGVDYKKYSPGTMRIIMNGIVFERIIDELLPGAKYIAVKLPNSYDFDYFRANVAGDIIMSRTYRAPVSCTMIILRPA